MPHLLPSLTTIMLAAAICAGLLWAIMPLLARYALARPNARSSHRIPTPQGAGIAVILATVAASSAVAYAAPGESGPLVILFSATLLIALLGAADDIRSLPVVTRLALQTLAVGIVIYAVPDSSRLAADCPLWIERTALLVAGVWFVNLVNFMDGLDWITVAEVLPITAALVVLGWLGELPPLPTIVAAALGGAMLGFAPFNKPVAKVFLGDVGSLPIGLLLGWCLLELALRGHLAAAVLLPLYYLADSTLTLLRRIARRETFWLAHRSHYYQRATDNGFTVVEVVSRMLVTNLVLVALALASVLWRSVLPDLLLLTGGAAAVALLLVQFARPRR